MSVTTIVVPTMGRPSLDVLLEALAGQRHPVDAPIILVDDRPGLDTPPLVPHGGGSTTEGAVGEPGEAASRLHVTVVRSGGGGPARARNLGWRRARTPWVSFLDDDVVPDEDWYELLQHDLRTDALGSCGRVRVPLPAERRPTDWERGTAGLAGARWITADLSYRREALATVGGFDERFPRAFREDADLALRLGGTLDERSTIVTGQRWITHPVRPSDDWASVRQQAGNADDMLMRRLHGPGWQRRADAPVGRRSAHVATTAAGVVALGTLAWDVIRRPGRRVPLRTTSALAAGAWLAGTAELAWRRIAPGPRDRDEVRRMLLTSLAIPPAATWHTARGLVRHRQATRWRGLPDLVLLDRDGTLVHDVPYNGDPARVTPVDGAKEALDRLRREGVRVAMVTNQSGVARGLITPEQVDAVNDRVAELLGPFDGVYVCPHGPDDGCACRKPAPGLVKQALADAGVAPARAVLIGDIGSDLAAAEAAGVTGVLVPTRQTLPDEVAAAETVAAGLPAAVDAVLRGAW